jgi:hypothetical protein
MKAPTRLALVCLLAPLAAACLENRPIVVSADGGSPSQTGAAGAAGQPSGAAGSAGSIGTVAGCDVSALFGTAPATRGKYTCTIQGACHDSQQSATGLDMTSADWEQKLLVTGASNGRVSDLDSMCLGTNEPYLIKGSFPARGLFMDKLKSPTPCGMQMPTIPGPITDAADMACIQSWANALTAQ